jgi:hypothetical protein
MNADKYATLTVASGCNLKCHSPFVIFAASGHALGPAQRTLQWALATLYSEARREEREADQLPISSAEVRAT